jgi:peroxiredoxin Q/BCP
VDDNRAFSEKFTFEFPLLCDTERTMGLAYGATREGSRGGARRVGVVIDGDGKIVSYEPSANAGTYPADVLATL